MWMRALWHSAPHPLPCTHHAKFTLLVSLTLPLPPTYLLPYSPGLFSLPPSLSILISSPSFDIFIPQKLETAGDPLGRGSAALGFPVDSVHDQDVLFMPDGAEHGVEWLAEELTSECPPCIIPSTPLFPSCFPPAQPQHLTWKSPLTAASALMNRQNHQSK